MKDSSTSDSRPAADANANDANRSAPQSRPRTPNRSLTGLAVALSIAGSGLIWYKLRVVTGVPRQAIADPELRSPSPRSAQPGAQAPSQSSPDTAKPRTPAATQTTPASRDEPSANSAAPDTALPR